MKMMMKSREEESTYIGIGTHGISLFMLVPVFLTFLPGSGRVSFFYFFNSLFLIRRTYTVTSKPVISLPHHPSDHPHLTSCRDKMATATETETETKPTRAQDDATEVMLERAERAHTKPLWLQMARLNPPLPNPRCTPFLWRYADVRPSLVEAGELVPEHQAERRVLMLVNPSRGWLAPPFSSWTAFVIHTTCGGGLCIGDQVKNKYNKKKVSSISYKF